uniref:Protein ETHYLENE-INSENSITIVE 2 n=1 Tax=Oryza punctata TaxID=4537 RepID=A0A0E0LHA8_ORYPU
MDGQQHSSDSPAAGGGFSGGAPHLFHALGPALLISMGYIDLGKWVAAVEAGSRFGFDLVLLALLFNFMAILCQYLAACIGTVTGRSLAEICHQEYSRPTCIFLGVQAGLSLLTSELTMIFGIALGFNLLFEYDDLITGICFATVVPNLLPYAISHLGKKMAGTLNACIAGFALLCYVLGLLVSQPQIPLTMNVIFPKLSGESAYSLMALLGANIMAHNFYVHSSVVQGQKRSAFAVGALFHDHLFSVLFIFTGIFLVNHVLMNSAAAESTNTLLLTFQDVVELMNQIFVNPMAPTIFLVVLLFSSHIISLTSAIGSQVISQHLFGINLPLSGHHLILKSFAIVPALYCAKVAGAEGIYQLLIICQIIQAMLLPSSVVPLFRVASSRLIMGAHRVSLHLEILTFLAFLLMLFSNIIFMAEMLFGDSGWMNTLKGNTGSPVVFPSTVLVTVACVSVAFSLYMAVTPLKSGSHESELQQEWSVSSQKELLNTTQDREETCAGNVTYEEDQQSDAVPSPRIQPDDCLKSALDYIDSSDTAIESDHDSHHSTAYTSTAPETCHSPSFIPEESKSVVAVDWPEPLEPISNAIVAEESTVDSVDSKSTAERDIEVEPALLMDNDKEALNILESDNKSLGGNNPSCASDDGPPSLTFSRGKGSDAGNGSGSLSRLSGLGRAARRQLAAILDEFWGHLFDYHGKLTQEASSKRFDILLGLDVRTPSSTVRADSQANEIPKSPVVRDNLRGSAFLGSSRDLMSTKNEMSNLDLTYGLQMGNNIGSSAWSQGMQLPSTQLQSSSNSLLDQGARLNSNFSTPSYSDNNQFYQPATIHGYQLASYLKQMNANRNPYSSMPLDPQRLPKSSASAVPTYVDSVMHARNQNLLASLGATPSQIAATSRIGTMMAERSYYDPSTLDGNENAGSSAYSKKYHSSPDISALIAASRSALLNESKLGGGTIGPQSYLSRLASERSQYTNSVARPAAPLAFDELSPPKLPRDIFSMQQSPNPSARSLWAKQPFEQLFGVSSTELTKSEFNPAGRSGGMTKDDFSYKESEAKLLQSLRFCISKLLKLEGSGWLFKQNGGSDEDLIDQVAMVEKLLQQGTSDNQLLLGDTQQPPCDKADIQYMRVLPNCGDDCIWRASLVVSFGVWCIRRVLDLSLVESRPELWGKYTYVLNRLQGILDPAFSKPRSALSACACLHRDIRVLNSPRHSSLVATNSIPRPIRGSFTTASVVLEMIKDVETAVSGRKGRSGTAAGDVAFPKGKENLASVLKRYKRRLSSKGQQ